MTPENFNLTDEQRNVCNRVLGDMWAMGHPTRQYLFYLVAPSLDGEQYLRNMIFCHMADSLLEAAAEIENRINGLRRSAEQLGLVGAAKHCVFWKAYADGIAHSFTPLTDDELIFIQHFRDQFLHGREFGYAERRTVHQKRGNAIVNIRVNTEEIGEKIGNMAEKGGGWQGVLLDLRRRYSVFESFFWTLSACLNVNEYNQLLRREIYENRTDLMRVVLEGDDFMTTHNALLGKPGFLWRLVDQRKGVSAGPPSLRDPLYEELNL